MNRVFSARLTELRRERGLSQKEAAEKLGVSQALLSHYEKGIRECGLDFICKAAACYDVSCDYLLGVIDTRHLFQETFDETDTAADSEFRTITLFRAATMLHDCISKSGAGNGEAIKRFYSLAIYRVAAFAAEAGFIPKNWFNLPYDSAVALCRAGMDMIPFSINSESDRKHSKPDSEPTCVKTVIGDAERQISEYAEKIFNNSHT